MAIRKIKKYLPKKLKKNYQVLKSPTRQPKKIVKKIKVNKVRGRKIYKKPRAKKLTPKQLLSKLQYLKSTRPPAQPLNIDFYRAADGVYTSYWLGKFINTLLSGGNKKTVAKYVYRAMCAVKFSTAANPLILFLELLDKIKPTFRLRNYVVRRVIIKEYPIVVLRPRRLILAVHWLREEVQSGSGKFATSLDSEIAAKLLDFKSNPKKNNLVKKRNEFTKRTIKAQFNIRYNFR